MAPPSASSASLTAVFSREKITALVIDAVGIYVAFITWAILQERITAQPYQRDGESMKFKLVSVLNLVQALCAFGVARLVLTIKGSGPAHVPRSDWIKAAISNTCSSPFGYFALSYVDYIFLVIGKSCKLVPVMLMKSVVSQTKFRLAEYIAVLLITIGIVLFKLYDGEDDVSFSRAFDANALVGLGLIGINLWMDGYTNALQDHIVAQGQQRADAAVNKDHPSGDKDAKPRKGDNPVTSYHVMGNVNLYSVYLLVGYLLIDLVMNQGSSTLSKAAHFFSVFPEAKWHILGFGICGAIGQVFIFRTLVEFGSLVNTTITITRKLLTIFLSSVLFGHDLNAYQWLAVFAVFFGLALQVVDQYLHKKKHHHHHKPAH